MKMKKYWVLVAISGICTSAIWATNNTNPQTSPQITITVDRRETLRSLQGVGIAIENLRPEVEKHGITKQQLQTDVELRLRQNGIKILSEQELSSTPGIPILHVNVSVLMNEKFGFAAYSISVDLYQSVFLAREPTKFCPASTWSCDEIGTVSIAEIERIREPVKDRVDEFINDYLAANPKDKQRQ